MEGYTRDNREAREGGGGNGSAAARTESLQEVAQLAEKMNSDNAFDGSRSTSFGLETEEKTGEEGKHTPDEDEGEKMPSDSAASYTSIPCYDLVLDHDTNTQGHTQWFYFAIRNMKKGETVRLRMVNNCKGTSLFNQGMKPVQGIILLEIGILD